MKVICSVSTTDNISISPAYCFLHHRWNQAAILQGNVIGPDQERQATRIQKSFTYPGAKPKKNDIKYAWKQWTWHLDIEYTQNRFFRKIRLIRWGLLGVFGLNYSKGCGSVHVLTTYLFPSRKRIIRSSIRISLSLRWCEGKTLKISSSKAVMLSTLSKI